MELSLYVSHVIHLTDEQRKDLATGKDVEVVGVSIPVWRKKTKVCEPAKEVFVKYKLGHGEEIVIKHNKTGYDILMHATRSKHSLPVYIELLDIKDGGTEWIAFRQNRIMKTKYGKEFEIIHFVQMKSTRYEAKVE